VDRRPHRRRIVRLDDPPFLLKFSYDEELRIVRMDER
jgi:hypothetical protein